MLPAAIGSWLAVVVAIRGEALAVLLFTGCLVVLLGLFWSRAPWLALSLIAVATVLAGLALRLTVLEATPWSMWIDARERVDVEAQLIVDAKRIEGVSNSVYMRIRINEVVVDEQHFRVRARATAFVQETGDLPVMGDRLRIRARLSDPNALRDVASLQVLEMEQSQPTKKWWQGAEAVRKAIRDAQSGRSDQAAALVPALVMGDESGLSAMTKHDFRRSGLTHLLAVSGANLTIVLVVVLGLLRAVGFRRLLVWVGLAVTIAFVLIARPEPSVQRAALMGVVAVFGLGCARSAAGLRALSWSVVMLLMIDPWLAVDFGFSLSVLATGGIILLANPLAERFERWAPRWCALALAVPLAAQLSCLPVVAALTGEVSLVSLLANILAAPVVAPATVFGLTAGLLELLWSPLAIPFAWGGWLAASWIVQVSLWSAGTSGAAISWIAHPLWLAPVAVFLVWLLFRWGSNAGVMLIVAMAMVLLVIRPFQVSWLSESAVLVACDVGQGDSFVIPLDKQAAIVVDVGEQPQDVHRCLNDLGIRDVPLLVLTHSDADHVGGLAGLFPRRDVDSILVGPSGAGNVQADTRLALEGDVFEVAGARIEVLWPRTADADMPPNDASLVLRIEYRHVSMLFLGDISAEVSRRLSHQIDAVNIVKVAHHGSGDMWPDLYDAAEPDVAVIGVGKANRHGHPHPDVIDALVSRSILTGRTDELGTFAVVSTGEGFDLVPQR